MTDPAVNEFIQQYVPVFNSFNEVAPDNLKVRLKLAGARQHAGGLFLSADFVVDGGEPREGDKIRRRKLA